jgi:hypothetical protein
MSVGQSFFVQKTFNLFDVCFRPPQQESFIEELTEIFPATNSDADGDADADVESGNGAESLFAPIEASELVPIL